MNPDDTGGPPQLQLHDGRATLTLNRPAQHNSLHVADLLALQQHFRALQADPAVRLLVITGTGRSFCSGFHLGDFDNQPAQPGALQLLTFTKAYSGLSDAEFRQVDAVIRASTLEKFGPVRSLKPSLVFELAFEGIARSPRHKSGIAVRFPRMLRWREDKPVDEADTLQTLAALLHGGGT